MPRSSSRKQVWLKLALVMSRFSASHIIHETTKCQKPYGRKDTNSGRSRTVQVSFPFLFTSFDEVFPQIFATSSVKARAPWASHAGIQTFKSPNV